MPAHWRFDKREVFLTTYCSEISRASRNFGHR